MSVLSSPLDCGIAVRGMDDVVPRYTVDIYSTADRPTDVAPRPLADNHTIPVSMLDFQSNWISGRAFAASNVAVASVTREVNAEQNEINSDRNTANNSASRAQKITLIQTQLQRITISFHSLLFLFHSTQSIILMIT